MKASSRSLTPLMLTMALGLGLQACSSSNSAATQADVRTTETPRSGSSVVEVSDASASETRTVETMDAGIDAGREYVLRDVLADLGEDTQIYVQHVATLSDPFFEGRSADVAGKNMAADYIAHYFEKYGLEPAFDGEDGTPSYQQPFTVRGGLKVTAADASWSLGGKQRDLVEGEDFNVLGFSANGNFTGPIEFVGYGIEEGEDGYSSFAEDSDLTGKIAMVLRFEPMNDEGRSVWSGGRRWSRHSGLVGKIQSAIDRGASAVILVNPPGADDERVERLETATTTRFGRMDVPVIMMSIDAADALTRAADPQGRTIYAMRRDADRPDATPVSFNGNLTFAMETGVERSQLPTQNVGGVLPGKGALANEWVIIGGHYDHVGYGRLSGASPSNVGKLHPGADDNASGTAGVMLIGRNMAKTYAEMPESADARSVLFLAFGAEEMGLLGAEHYVENMTMSSSQVTAMLNLDMIGRVTDNKVEVDGMGSADDIEAVYRPHFDASPLDVVTSQGVAGNSDHAVFYRADIPATHFFTGLHPDYHRPGDTFEKVNFKGGVQVSHLIEAIATDLATRPERLEHQRATGRQSARNRTGSSVRLGIAPGSYGEDDESGVEVGDVYDGTSAADGGMLAGDRIIRWDGADIVTVQDMMGKLMSAKPGDVAKIVVVRDGKEVALDVTLKAREEAGG